MQNPTNPFISFTSQTLIIDQAGPAVNGEISFSPPTEHSDIGHLCFAVMCEAMMCKRVVPMQSSP